MGVGKFEVVELELGNFGDFALHKGLDLLQAVKLLGGFQDAVDVGGGLELVGREAAVAGAHGQSVGLSHDGAGDNLAEDAALAAHLTDDGNLLVVLLAEVGLVRAHPLEQAAHDDAHAVEVSRTGGTFHHVGNGTEVVNLAGGHGEDFLHAGGEDVVGQVADQLHVSLQGAGILFQVLGVVELRGVHEDGAEDHVVLLVGATDKGDVSLVKGAHSRHHADALAGSTLAHGYFQKSLNGINYFHNNVLFNYLRAKTILPKTVAKV